MRSDARRGRLIVCFHHVTVRILLQWLWWKARFDQPFFRWTVPLTDGCCWQTRQFRQFRLRYLVVLLRGATAESYTVISAWTTYGVDRHGRCHGKFGPWEILSERTEYSVHPRIRTLFHAYFSKVTQIVGQNISWLSRQSCPPGNFVRPQFRLPHITVHWQFHQLQPYIVRLRRNKFIETLCGCAITELLCGPGH